MRLAQPYSLAHGSRSCKKGGEGYTQLPARSQRSETSRLCSLLCWRLAIRRGRGYSGRGLHHERRPALRVLPDDLAKPGETGLRMSMTVDCSAILHMTIAITPDACAGARAALRAAEIQAKAARHAGAQNLFSGVATLVAGILAFSATLVASRMQIVPIVRQERLRALAFNRHLLIKIDLVPLELANSRQLAKLIGNSRKTWDIDRTLSDTNAFLAEISPDRWENLLPAGPLLPVIHELHREIGSARHRVKSFMELCLDMPTGPEGDVEVEKAFALLNQAVDTALESIKNFQKDLIDERPSGWF